MLAVKYAIGKSFTLGAVVLAKWSSHFREVNVLASTAAVTVTSTGWFNGMDAVTITSAPSAVNRVGSCLGCTYHPTAAVAF
jgi:hypothetical protein